MTFFLIESDIPLVTSSIILYTCELIQIDQAAIDFNLPTSAIDIIKWACYSNFRFGPATMGEQKVPSKFSWGEDDRFV